MKIQNYLIIYLCLNLSIVKSATYRSRSRSRSRTTTSSKSWDKMSTTERVICILIPFLAVILSFGYGCYK